MFERAYRQRLEADVARWQADGVITPVTGEAIRNSLPPLGAGINIPVVVGIVGGLLIAAAFLAFVASNWTEIARVLRFAILLAGIAATHGVGAVFAHTGRPVLADLAASVGTVIFGAAIALVGQMYHLGDDFAAGLLLWAGGALATAALTSSRGTLAVALMAGSLWSGARVFDTGDVPHLPFIPFWMLAAVLALAWNSRVAAHLVAIAALAWWCAPAGRGPENPFIIAHGAALLLGGGLLLGNAPSNPLRSFGVTLSTYGAFGTAALAALAGVLSSEFRFPPETTLAWATGSGFAGMILAFVAAAVGRRAGPIFAGISIACVLVVAVGRAQPVAAEPWPATGEPWLAYALELVAMLCLVISGTLDGARARAVAGWLGLAAVIAYITWAVKGSLLRRSMFLAAAGTVAIALAMLLGRVLPKESRP
jgi:uncharacterized membrane protein